MGGGRKVVPEGVRTTGTPRPQCMIREPQCGTVPRRPPLLLSGSGITSATEQGDKKSNPSVSLCIVGVGLHSQGDDQWQTDANIASSGCSPSL